MSDLPDRDPSRADQKPHQKALRPVPARRTPTLLGSASAYRVAARIGRRAPAGLRHRIRGVVGT